MAEGEAIYCDRSTVVGLATTDLRRFLANKIPVGTGAALQ